MQITTLTPCASATAWFALARWEGNATLLVKASGYAKKRACCKIVEMDNDMLFAKGHTPASPLKQLETHIGKGSRRKYAYVADRSQPTQRPQHTMSIREGAWQSKNDSNFILRALRSGRRVDGRKLSDMRLLRMVFARAEGQASCEVQLGRTRVLAVVKGEVVPPFPDRPTEGFLHFNVELGPMAAASVGERNSPLSVEIARVIEIGVRDSQALDTEALCILGGEKVWQLRCDIHILDHGGNLIDASALATMAALRHFRRPEVTIDGNKVIVHHTDDKEPQPLALHHVPICVTFAVFEDDGESDLGHRPGGGAKGGVGVSGVGGGGMAGLGTIQHRALDPTEAEEEVMKGRVTFALTAHKELCALHKNGGVAMTSDTILGCARLAAVKVEEIHKVLDQALATADAKAALDRQKRLRGTAPTAAGPGPAPVAIPGTRSTPFVVGQTPMPIASESLKVKHLEYDDLHVTQSIREEGLRGGGNRGGRGLNPADARSTDLFAKMAKAASMTQASMDNDDSNKEKVAKLPRNRQDNLDRDAKEIDASHQHAAEKMGNGTRSSEESRTAGGDAMEEEGNGGSSASANAREFEQLAQTLRKSEAIVAGTERKRDNVTVGVGRQSTENKRDNQAPSSTTTMDIDSEEEETVTLAGEFQTSTTRPIGKVEGDKASEAMPKPAGPETSPPPTAVAAATDSGVGGSDDDLMSAVKKGKGKKSKGRAKGGKRKA